VKTSYSFLLLIIQAAFVVACLLVFVLSFYLSTVHLIGATGHGYTAWDAVWVLFSKLYFIAFAPRELTNDQHALLDFFGNSLVSFVGVTAVVLSTLAVRAKLAELDGLLLYEKFDTAWIWRTLQSVPFLNNSASIHEFLDRKIERRYRHFRVMKLVHYYRAADRLLIVSGNYSWLFDPRWGKQVRRIIIDLLPDRICLVSNRLPREVADFWKRFPDMRSAREIFEAMSFTEQSNDYNASIVKTGQEKLYMYLYKERHKPTRRSYVCIFRGDREAETLVKLVEDEFARLHEAALKNPEREGEKRELLTSPEYFG